jgi:hypothetical protein
MMKRREAVIVAVLSGLWGATVYAQTGCADPRAFGALGDGVQNDGPAIQAALDSVAGGGTVCLSPGNYRVASTVYKNFAGTSPRIVIKGSGSGSRILVDANTSTSIFWFESTSTNSGHFRFEDVTFANKTPFNFSAKHLVRFTAGAFQSIFLRNVSVFGAYGSDSLVSISGGSPVVENLEFYGCALTTGGGASALEFQNTSHATVRDFKLVDYGVSNGTYYAGGSMWSALRLKPLPAGQQNATGFVSSLDISGLFCDEGPTFCVLAESLYPDYVGRADWVRISNFRISENSIAPATAIRVRKANRVEISNGFIGYAANLRNAIEVYDGGAVIARNVGTEVGRPSASIFYADSVTQKVRITHSTFSNVNSAAGSTVVE